MPIEVELSRALQRSSLVVCVGSGPSVAAGLPELDQLARTLVSRARAFDPSLDAAGLEQWIEQRRSPEVLEQVQRCLGAEFQREVERELSDQGRPLPPLVLSLTRLRKQLRAIYTMRLDRLIERGLEGRWPSFSAPRPDLAQRSALVFKLRGTLEFPQSWVLTREQEEREFGPDSARRAVFEASFRAHELLFVGFEADSHELRRLLDMMPASVDGHGPSHYIVLPVCSPLDRDRLERRGLRVAIANAEALLDGLAGHVTSEVVAPPSAADCPYPGLEAFSESQADRFFGRHAEISQAASLLGGLGGVDNRWLAIEGPSGVGKSSFARAGVVPALREGFAEGTPGRWIVATVRPGTNPLANLVKATCEALGVADVSGQLDQSPRWLVDILRQRVGPGHGFLLLVDQLEEIVTIAPESERAPFGEAITRALDARVLYLITTTRSDLVPALQRGMPSLAGLLNEVAQRYALPPISRIGLREAICEPAARQGVTMAPDLVEQILLDAEAGQSRASDDKTRTADATLPLVAHILRGLWTDEHVADGVIALDEYLALGGIAGALSRSADTLVDALGDRPDVRQLFLRLIRLQPDGTATRRVVGLDEARSVSDEHVLGALSGASLSQAGGPSARLLIVRDDDGASEVEIVHEALIRDWGRLNAWIEQNREQLQLDDELALRASRWVAEGRGTDALPRGADMRALLSARPHGSAAQQQQQHAFKAAMRSHRNRRRALAGGAAGTALALALFVGWRINSNVNFSDACTIEIEHGADDRGIEVAVVVAASGLVAKTTVRPRTLIEYACERGGVPQGLVVGPAMIQVPLGLLVLPGADEQLTLVVQLEGGEVRHFEAPGRKVPFRASKPGLPPGLSVEQLTQLAALMPADAVVEALAMAGAGAKPDAAGAPGIPRDLPPDGAAEPESGVEPAIESGGGAETGAGSETGAGLETGPESETGAGSEMDPEAEMGPGAPSHTVATSDYSNSTQGNWGWYYLYDADGSGNYAEMSRGATYWGHTAWRDAACTAASFGDPSEGGMTAHPTAENGCNGWTTLGWAAPSNGSIDFFVSVAEANPDSSGVDIELRDANHALLWSHADTAWGVNYEFGGHRVVTAGERLYLRIAAGPGGSFGDTVHVEFAVEHTPGP